MSDTPETDSAFDALRRGACGTNYIAEFARKLERQRNELLEALEDMLGGGLEGPTQQAITKADAIITKVKEAA